MRLLLIFLVLTTTTYAENSTNFETSIDQLQKGPSINYESASCQDCQIDRSKEALIKFNLKNGSPKAKEEALKEASLLLNISDELKAILSDQFLEVAEPNTTLKGKYLQLLMKHQPLLAEVSSKCIGYLNSPDPIFAKLARSASSKAKLNDVETISGITKQSDRLDATSSSKAPLNLKAETELLVKLQSSRINDQIDALAEISGMPAIGPDVQKRIQQGFLETTLGNTKNSKSLVLNYLRALSIHKVVPPSVSSKCLGLINHNDVFVSTMAASVFFEGELTPDLEKEFIVQFSKLKKIKHVNSKNPELNELFEKILAKEKS